MKLKKLAALLTLCALCAGHCAALEYTMDAPSDYLFGRPTSVEIVYGQEEAVNIDRSKNVALIPPGFGTPTSYLPGSGEYLTPNLVPGALGGGLVNAVGEAVVSAGYVSTDAGYPMLNPVSPTDADAVLYANDNANDNAYDNVSWEYESPDYGGNGYDGISFTDVSESLYYNGGHLGTLKIPSIGVSVKIYEGTSSTQLAKGAGHFTDTSIWDGNVSLAAHNRGTNNYFGKIHTLKPGDEVTLTTKLGTRTYAVESVKKITETDNSDTAATWENRLTLFTCVRDEREYRWRVRAVEV